MLVRLAGSNKRLAPMRLVHALDKVQLLQLFQCTIDGDQAKGRVLRTGNVKYLNRGEGAIGRGNCFYHSAARFGQPVSIFL
jgi:hypothetical protein